MESNFINVVVLFLDDDKDLKLILEDIFKREGVVNYKWFLRSDALLSALNDNTQVCVVDQILGGGDIKGIEVIEKIKAINPSCHCILMSNYDQIDTIIEAYDKGCDKYIRKGDLNFVKKLISSIGHAIEMVNKKFESHVAILSRMEESLKIFNEIKVRAN